MATNYLSNLNYPIVINSALINNSAARDALLLLSKRNAEDLNRIADYVNLILVPGLSTLASKPSFPYDAVESGISGNTIVTYLESDGNTSLNSAMFWKAGATPEEGRPCTIKESFDYVLSATTERVLELRENPVDLSEVWGQIACNARKIEQVKFDTLGEKYFLSCNSDPSLTYSLSRHLKEILSQLTNDPNNISSELDVGSSDYPTLTLNAGLLANSTEILRGVSEIATVQEIKDGSVGSDSGAEIVITPSRLIDGLKDLNTSSELRNSIKDIADQEIKESSIGDLEDVSLNDVSNGDTLVYNDGSWSNGNVLGSATLGSDTVESSLIDVTGLVTNNYDGVFFDKYAGENNKLSTYLPHGINYSYIFTEDNLFKNEDSSVLAKKKIPFLFRTAPKTTIYDQAPINLVNQIVNREKGIQHFRGILRQEYLGQQARCTFVNESTQSHLIEPNKILGVCRSDVEYGGEITENNSGDITGSPTTEFDSFIKIGNNVPLQESGITPVMILGPYSIGDSVYICPEGILSLLGIKNSLGIGITERFFNEGLTTLTSGLVNSPLSLFDIMLRDASVTFLTTLNELEIKSKQLGIVVNGFFDNFDASNNGVNEVVNNLCYSMLEVDQATDHTSFTLYVSDEVSEIAGTSSILSDSRFVQFLFNAKTLSLPIVKLTI